MKYPEPKTDNEEVLITAIRKGYVDCIMFGWMSGFRTRCSDLRRFHKVPFLPERITKKNRHGHVISIVRHHLKTQKAKDQALGIYLKMKKAA